MDWTILGSGISLIVLNAFLWVFRWGKSTGNVNTRLNNLEEKTGNPDVLPECAETFTQIRENLSGLNGKVETIIDMVKDGGKGKDD